MTFGVSVENPDQYAGGSGGGSSITLPSASSRGLGTQLDNSSGTSAAATYPEPPTVTPDIIAKVAFDPSSRFHLEVAGIERNFKTVNPALLTSTSPTTGGGVELRHQCRNLQGLPLDQHRLLERRRRPLPLRPGARPDRSRRRHPEPVHSGGFIGGFEETIKNTLLYAYYGGDYIGRDVAIDANGKSLIGYGYTGSANSQNRAINEITFGFNQTIWKDASYGAINLMGQYEYLMRDPWYVAVGAPKNTHDNTIYFNVRYTLPGSAPNF